MLEVIHGLGGLRDVICHFGNPRGMKIRESAEDTVVMFPFLRESIKTTSRLSLHQIILYCVRVRATTDG